MVGNITKCLHFTQNGTRNIQRETTYFIKTQLTSISLEIIHYGKKKGGKVFVSHTTDKQTNYETK